MAQGTAFPPGFNALCKMALCRDVAIADVVHAATATLLNRRHTCTSSEDFQLSGQTALTPIPKKL